jgi:hypothetical protein
MVGLKNMKNKQKEWHPATKPLKRHRTPETMQAEIKPT